MKDFSKRIVLVALGCFASTYSQAADFNTCEAEGFKDCFYGTKYGEEFSDETLQQICKLPGNMQTNENLQPAAGKPTPVCKPASGLKTETRPPVYKGDEKFAAFHRRDAVPQVLATGAMFVGLTKPEQSPQTKAADGSLLMPVKLNSDANSRFAIVINKKLVGYATTSSIEKELDPMFYVLEAKKKYGQVDGEIEGDEAGKLFEGSNRVLLWQAPKMQPRYLVGVIGETSSNVLVVKGIVAQSAAETAGVKVGDIIETVNGNPVANINEFKAKTSESPESIKLRLRTKKGTREVTFSAAKNPRNGDSALARALVFYQDADDFKSVSTVVLHVNYFSEQFIKLVNSLKKDSQKPEVQGAQQNNVDL